MLKRVILHVGPSKTGTTAIQGALSAIAGQLQHFGIFYPETTPPSREGQPSLAWEILETLGTSVARLSKADASWDNVLREAQSSGAHTLLISAEDFTLEFFDAKAMASLKKILCGLRISVIFALRDPVSAVPSMWQQAVKWGVGLGEEVMDIDDAVPFILQRDRIQVVPYLRMANSVLECETRMFTVPARIEINLLLQRFAEAAALPPPVTIALCEAGALQNSNEGISYGQTRVLLRLNRILYELDPSASRYPQNGSEHRLTARTAVLRSLPAEKKAGIPLTPESHTLLVDARKRIVEWIAGIPDQLIGSQHDLTAQIDYVHPRIEDSVCDDDALARLLVVALAAQTKSYIAQQTYLTDVEGARDWWKTTSENWARLASEQGSSNK